MTSVVAVTLITIAVVGGFMSIVIVGEWLMACAMAGEWLPIWGPARRCQVCRKRYVLRYRSFGFAGESIVSEVYCSACGAVFDTPDTYGCKLIQRHE
jgi:hypothetical protein